MRKPKGMETVDKHVGRRVRDRRRRLGITQAELAEALQLAPQQVQKYEHGVNRVSASTLFAIAQVLDTSVGYYFDGLVPPGAVEEPSEAMRRRTLTRELVGSRQGAELADAFLSISRASVRERLLGLARSIAQDEADRSADADSPA